MNSKKVEKRGFCVNFWGIIIPFLNEIIMLVGQLSNVFLQRITQPKRAQQKQGVTVSFFIFIFFLYKEKIL